jgi:hypothetical protein
LRRLQSAHVIDNKPVADGTIEDLIGKSVEESHAAHCMVLALVEMLADRGLLEGSVESLLGELGRRTQDIRLSQLAEVWDREQARILRERFEQLLESRRVQ